MLTWDLHSEEALKLKKGRGREIIGWIVLKKVLGMAAHSVFFLIFRLFLLHFPLQEDEKLTELGTRYLLFRSEGEVLTRTLFTGRRRTPSHRDVNVSPSTASVHVGPGGAEGGAASAGGFKHRENEAPALISR